MADDLFISDKLSLPSWEIQESFVQASGPGGQNVNKVATAVQLRWNIEASSLPAPVKARFRKRFSTRITQDGDVILDARQHRSQAQNRKAARDRLIEMVRAVAHPPKRRIPTRPTGGSVRRRLSAKKQRAEVKALRGKIGSED